MGNPLYDKTQHNPLPFDEQRERSANALRTIWPANAAPPYHIADNVFDLQDPPMRIVAWRTSEHVVTCAVGAVPGDEEGMARLHEHIARLIERQKQSPQGLRTDIPPGEQGVLALLAEASVKLFKLSDGQIPVCAQRRGNLPYVTFATASGPFKELTDQIDEEGAE